VVIVSKKNKNVLFLSTYPFDVPRHGGQLRSKAICDRYVKEGFNVIKVAIVAEESYVGEYKKGDNLIYPCLSKYRTYYGDNVPLISDLTSGYFASESPEITDKICSNIKCNIDLIHVEQPWLFKLAKKLKVNIPKFKKSILVYGSQNIECELKRGILHQAGIHAEVINNIIYDIKELEIYAAKNSDVILTVSDYDKNYLERFVAKEIVIARNAAHKRRVNQEKVISWKNELPCKYFLFVASAHPPNVSGFFSALGEVLGFLAPDSKIVVVGSVNEILSDHPAYQKWKLINETRLIRLGVLDEDDLSAVIQLAHAILIPITEGGGSNLKTAEALLSGKYVISTSVGFRGFEDHMDADNVFISDLVDGFRNNMRRVWDLDPRTFTNERSDELTWEVTLNKFFEQLV